MTETRRHKKNLKERGITLIALVITIIVLLILAGVALSTLTGDSGILKNAESAKGNTNLANAKEQIELAVQGAKLENVSKTGEMTVTYANLKNELDNIVGNGKYKIAPEEEKDSWTVTVGEYEVTVSKNGSVIGPRDIETLKGILTTEGTTPWLPEGFSRVTKFNEGLVIANTTNGTEGTQNYVWIEVPNNIKQKITVDSTEKTISLTETTTDKEIELVLHAYASSEEDATKGNYRSGAWTDEWYDSAGNTVNSQDANLQDDTGCGMNSEQYASAYAKMLKSIQKYGGFWLAQYEAGISYDEGYRTYDSERISNNPESANYAKDQYPYNFVYCSEAQKIANADSTDEYTSSLLFGIQWDLVCKFLEVKEAKTYEEIAINSTWGIYWNTGWTSSASSKYSDDYCRSFTPGTKTKTSGGDYLLTTGAIEEVTVGSNKYKANPMNIYDFAGNASELTLEHAAIYADRPCTCRGGWYDDLDEINYPVTNREGLFRTNNESYNIGFRSTLY